VNRRFADVRRLDVVSSTNDEALKAIAGGAGPGCVFVAQAQTAGRGRRGAAWVSPPGGGLFLSAIIAKPAPGDAPLVAGAAGIAAADAIRAVTGADAGIKWPNDLWVRERKVGGVLIEVPGGDRGLAVVGIGITLRDPGDCETRPGAAPLAGLCDLLGRPFAPEHLCAEVLAALDAALTLVADDPGTLRLRYRGAEVLLGRDVRVEAPGGTVAGRVADVDLVEGIEIVLEDGSRRRLKPEHTHVVAVLPRAT
jgi:BirA family transcriptional regulator, biotin operon repressor / biotin---[acetyl-CoA-carboxylase] ligase